MFPAVRFFFHIAMVSLIVSLWSAGHGAWAVDRARHKAQKAHGFKAPAKSVLKKLAITDSSKSVRYKPEKLVRVDFSAVDFLFIGAANRETAGAGLLSASSRRKVCHMPEHMFFFTNTGVMAEKDIAATLVRFYTRNPVLIWSTQGRMNYQAKAVLAYFSRVGGDGLDPVEYKPDMPSGALEGNVMRPEALVRFDVALSARVLRYVSDASSGRIIPEQLSHYYDLPRKTVDLTAALIKIHRSKNPEKVLASYQPQSRWYATLKSELAALDDIKLSVFQEIPPDILIHPGDGNEALPRVVKLLVTRTPRAFMEKFQTILKKHENATVYDMELKPVIKAYQKLAGKTTDGVIGPVTIAALQGETPYVRRRRVLNAMERLRWLPDDFSARYVFINQPAFEAQYFENGIEKLAMKAVIGSPGRATNFFYDRIRLVVFNPSWGVPRSIMVNEMIPRILADSSYLSRNGYDVYNSKGKKVDPRSVDWRRAAKAGGVYIRQKPGQNNALGAVKIMFPNRHDIYMHDTPAKTVFARDMRALSHGCVRLANAADMAAAVMGVKKDSFKPYYAKKERTVTLKESVPVYLVYFTAWPDAATREVKYYNDVYSLDNAMQVADQEIRRSRYGEASGT